MQVTRRWLAASALVVASLELGATSPALTRSFDAAADAWERGDYGTALSGYLQVVSAPGGEAFFERIALTTGELFETRELTPDGRAPRSVPTIGMSSTRSGSRPRAAPACSATMPR